MRSYISEILNSSLKKLGVSKKEIILEKPNEEKFGDLSSSLALSLARKLKTNPRKIAQDIIDNIEYDKNLIDKIEIAGAGFINFFLSDKFYIEVLKLILQKKSDYGKLDKKGKTANIEWVSANPTGPLHAGHGRHVCLGKAVANLLEWIGYDVTREYYYNDAGNQMWLLGESIERRYEQLCDMEQSKKRHNEQIIESKISLRSDMYKGEYVKTIAKNIYNKNGDKFITSLQDFRYWREQGEKYCLNLIENTLKKLDIKHDVFFKESSLYPYNIRTINTEDVDNIDELYKNENYSSSGIIRLLYKFKSVNLIYKKDNAWWLKMKSGGFKEDEGKVIIKSDDIASDRRSEPTYRLPDMAYHIDKIKRNYDLILDIFGSDHSDTYKEVLYGVKSAGYDISNIKVIIHQMVTFKEGDELIKMSKRHDNVYYLDDLIEDVGVDATQFFFVMRGANTHLDFDIKLAKEQSEKNPVYYLQYAHARICGILRNADENFLAYKETGIDKINFDLIQSKDEINLLKVLSRFPDEVVSAASSYEPHKIITYLNSVAESFHRFYHNQRVLNLNDEETTLARLQICLAAKQVLKNGFDIIGISAHERM